MWLPFVKVTDLMHLDFHRRLINFWVAKKLSTFQNGPGSVAQLIEQFLAFPNGSASCSKTTDDIRQNKDSCDNLPLTSALIPASYAA